MPILRFIARLTTTRRRSYRLLLQADCFVVGRIGANARISSTEQALSRIIREPSTAIPILLDLLEHASIPGQLYALLGLRECRYARIEELLKQYRERTQEVTVQVGCLRYPQPVCNIVARIADGIFSLDATDAN